MLTIEERRKERQVRVVLEAKLKVLSDFANHVGMENFAVACKVYVYHPNPSPETS